MRAIFEPSFLQGRIASPTSKSIAHRYLIAAALSGEVCRLDGVDLSEDILATMDCLRALGAKVDSDGDGLTVDGKDFLKGEAAPLLCRESGSTLRFFIPLALCLGKKVSLYGSARLLERPLDVYEELCREKGFFFEKKDGAVTLCGRLSPGSYQLRGDISSQFITGLIFALVYLGGPSRLTVLPPFESRSYVALTLAALRAFGADVFFADGNTVEIRPSRLHAFSGRVEGDYSNAAFLEAFNRLGAAVNIENLDPNSLQGDRVYGDYFDQIEKGVPTLDLTDCPDLGPVLFALAAMKNGAVFTGTDRLKAKESDRGLAMHEELAKLGGGLLFGDNRITVPKSKLCFMGKTLYGHNDHRIVMALSVILAQIGGELCGVEAVNKSYPRFFEEIQRLGAKVKLYDR